MKKYFSILLLFASVAANAQNVYANLSELLPGRNVKGNYMPQTTFALEVFIPTK